MGKYMQRLAEIKWLQGEVFWERLALYITDTVQNIDSNIDLVYFEKLFFLLP